MCVTPFTVTDSIVHVTTVPTPTVCVADALVLTEEPAVTEAPEAPFAPAIDVELAAAPFAPAAPWTTTV